jgi:hypothetical protein
MSTDRDRLLETLLRQSNEDDGELSSAAQCVDAEVLAAWVDGALSSQALAEAEKHAAGCARCQALLASMAKTAPAAEVRPWWHAVPARWLMPVAAVATALLVWVSVGPRREAVPSPPAPSVATSPPEPAPRSAVAPEPAQTRENAQSLADRAKDRAVELKNGAAIEQRARSAAAAAGGSIAAPQRIDTLDKTADAVSARPRAGSAGEIAAAPYPVKPLPASAPAQPAPASPPPRQEAPTFATGPPVPQPRAPAAETSVAESAKITADVEAKRLAAGSGGGIAAFGPTPEIRSPQPDYRWRIVPPSRIQRSVDGGATWSVVDPVASPGVAGGVPAGVTGGVPAMVLTTGSSPSRDVCWIVGRAGVVLVTTDGATWQRRSIPGSPDLIGARAVDARAATVTTADGRQFATLDGGATWTLVK